MLFQPVADPGGDDFILQSRKPLHFLGVKRENLVGSAVREFADKSPFQDHLQLCVGNSLNKLVEELPLQFIVKARDLQELVVVVLYLFPKCIVLVIDRDKKNFTRVPVKKIDNLRVGIFKAVQEVVPDYLHFTHNTHRGFLLDETGKLEVNVENNQFLIVWFL